MRKLRLNVNFLASRCYHLGQQLVFSYMCKLKLQTDQVLYTLVHRYPRKILSYQLTIFCLVCFMIEKSVWLIVSWIQCSLWIFTVTHKYNTSLICTLLLCRTTFLLCWARLALPSIYRLCRVFFSYAKHFSAILSPFLLCQAFFFHADHLFPLPSIFFLLCWALLSSSEHFWPYAEG